MLTNCQPISSVMKHTSLSCAIGIVLLLSAVPALQSQWLSQAAPEPLPDVLSPEPRRFFLGFFAGVNVNEHPGTFKPDQCDECIFSDGSGKGAFLGAQIEYHFLPYAGVALKLALDDKRADYTTPLPGRKRILIDPNTNLADSNSILDFERTSSVFLSYITINPMVMLIPLRNVYLMGGIALGVPVKKNYSVKERPLDPNLTYFSSGTSEVVLADEASSEVPDVKTRLDARVGAGYNIRLSPVVLLAPEVIYDIPLSTIAAEPTWKAQTLHLLAVLKITL